MKDSFASLSIFHFYVKRISVSEYTLKDAIAFHLLHYAPVKKICQPLICKKPGNQFSIFIFLDIPPIRV